MSIDDLGRASLNSAVPMLHPDEQVWEEMLDGWRKQQLARNLAFQTIEQRERLVRRFQDSIGEYPWSWSAAHADEFFGDRRAIHGNARSTLRSYENALRLFCDYTISPDYNWAEVCEHLFGTHPIQICHEWNTAAHVQESERGPRKRAFTKTELQALFDRADDEVARIVQLGRKGWLAAFRDATLLKVAYAYGLRWNEVRHVATYDFSPNPAAPEFGKFGVLNVRFGKAMKGSAHKQRSVLTVFKWGVEILEDWLERGLPHSRSTTDLFTSERGLFVSDSTMNARFCRYREELGFGAGLDFHSLRRSYVTHLIEDGWDPRFVQEQVGHEYSSTTGLYTSVSSDYRTRTLRRVLDNTVSRAITQGTEG